MRIGIDVGGTNTDAVLMDGHKVVGWTKSPTTLDVNGGITNALTSLMTQTKVTPDVVASVMLGTTHFTNAVVQRRSLSRSAVVRVGLPATAALPRSWTGRMICAMPSVAIVIWCTAALSLTAAPSLHWTMLRYVMWHTRFATLE